MRTVIPIAMVILGAAMGFALTISQVNDWKESATGWKESATSTLYSLKRQSCLTQYWKARALSQVATSDTYNSCVASLGPPPASSIFASTTLPE